MPSVLRKGVTAIVDYAHTPDALINVLNAIHGVLEGKGKVITVVGAGGNRDKENALSWRKKQRKPATG